jgi:enoyl-CoA hydratase
MKTLYYSEDGYIATLTIKHPPANALTPKMLDEISEILDMIEDQNKLKVIIIKGEGKFFSAGADVKQFTSYQKETDYESLAKKGQDLFNRMEHFHIPIIASIHGVALGGGLELALGCHMRIVTENAKLGLLELTIGIIPGYGGTQRLPQLVGPAKAYEMILTGNTITGIEAERLGLANLVVAEVDLHNETIKLAEKIAEKSRGSINRVMELIPYTKTEQFSAGLEAEAKAFRKIFGTEQVTEGIQAFIEKRKPNFQD